MKLTNTEIQQHITELPDNVRRAVMGFNWADEITTIGREFGLHMDQIGALQYETMMIILGLSPSASYSNALVHALEIDKNTAEEIVMSANAHVFTELQDRAFGPKEKPKPTIDDDYLEDIDYHDLRGPMSREGIHLIDDDAPKPQTDLQGEINDISLRRNPGIDNRSLDSFEMNREERNDHIEDNNSVSEFPFVNEGNGNPVITSDTNSVIARHKAISSNTTNLITPNNTDSVIASDSAAISEKHNTPNTYNEPIEATDIKGIKGHRMDLNILKQRSQQNNLEEKTPSVAAPQITTRGRDLGQGNMDLSLDKHLMENPFIAKGDVVDVSPTEQEQIKEEGTFLQNLKTEL